MSEIQNKDLKRGSYLSKTPGQMGENALKFY